VQGIPSEDCAHGKEAALACYPNAE